MNQDYNFLTINRTALSLVFAEMEKTTVNILWMCVCVCILGLIFKQTLCKHDLIVNVDVNGILRPVNKDVFFKC